MYRARRFTRDGDDRSIASALMFCFDTELRVYLYREPIDFRAGINSLVNLVEQSMQIDLLARAVYAFSNRRANRIKLLLWERGVRLMLRRLEADRLVWPRRQQAVIELTTEQLHWLLEGIDTEAVRRHPSRRYRPETIDTKLD
ncbi:IS66 family insertion sequence element accessory protein TnpB [Paraburkholderia atlantica]|uniref:Transposase n=2 Tax=Paraburkholderia atlantica TaxID=2654982 RepID=A0A7W8QEE6_PARAM|nr:IS66 family insertion sequence element accessory protein TnpB [Paraburkholderia atlantica]MBB5420471.1 transposase [Paraburkholderia atlantica]MBB5428917.1 transposase [Paraburkholderia atlantica]